MPSQLRLDHDKMIIISAFFMHPNNLLALHLLNLQINFWLAAIINKGCSQFARQSEKLSSLWGCGSGCWESPQRDDALVFGLFFEEMVSHPGAL